MNVRWKTIKEFPSYEINSKFIIRNKKTLRRIKSRIGWKGRIYFSLCKNGKMYSRLAHRIIWESKYGKIPKGLTINHIDFNPQNNDINNLELLTLEQNRNHSGVFNKPIELFNIHENKSYKFKARYHATKELGINNGKIYDLISGKQTQHKGWVLIE